MNGILAMRNQLWNSASALVAIQAFCIAVFLVDVGYEAHQALVSPQQRGFGRIAHVASEGVALVFLVFGYVIAHAQLLRVRQAKAENKRLLMSLRGQFDTLIMGQFAKWSLSKAESDIALLSLRGMKICEIARMRATAEGTIKAQLSAVYHKSGLGSRTELLAYFMDEFLDFSANPFQMDGRGTAGMSAAR